MLVFRRQSKSTGHRCDELVYLGRVMPLWGTILVSGFQKTQQ